MKTVLPVLLSGLLLSLQASADPGLEPEPAPPPPASPVERHFLALAGHLATSQTPRDLYVAARLYDRVEVSRRVEQGRRDAPSAQRSPVAEALMQRAIDLGQDDPLILWAAAADCPASAAVCDAPAAVQRLRAIAPNNAAVWVLPAEGVVLGEPRGDVASRDEDEALRLERIAAASRYDTYAGDRARLYHDLLGRTAIPDTLIERLAEPGAAATRDGARAALTFALLHADRPADARGLRDLCSESTLEFAPASRRDDCIEAAQRIAQRADTPLAVGLAQQSLLRLLPAGAARDRVQRDAQQLEWQRDARLALAEALSEDGAARAAHQADELQRWLQPGATELGVLRATLQAEGIALEPPASWRTSAALLPALSAR